MAYCEQEQQPLWATSSLCALKSGDSLSWKPPNVTLASSCSPTFRVCSFNIERGFKADGVSAWLRDNAIDVALLQELDVGCLRTRNKNTPHEIAQSANMCVCFTVEFQELSSKNGGGVHGNAILSRYPIIRSGSFRFKSQPYNWESKGWWLGQPRKGGRVCVWADIEIPGLPTPLRVYSVHFENFTGISGRLEQFTEVLQHCNTASGCPPGAPAIIGGDFNTLMHGVLRFLPGLYPTTDNLRFSTFGYSEAAWWQQHIFGPTGAQPAATIINSEAIRELANGVAHPEEWNDPFNKDTDITRVGTLGLWSAKLDWLVSRKLKCVGKNVSGEGLSDHLAIWVEYSSNQAS